MHLYVGELQCAAAVQGAALAVGRPVQLGWAKALWDDLAETGGVLRQFVGPYRLSGAGYPRFLRTDIVALVGMSAWHAFAPAQPGDRMDVQ